MIATSRPVTGPNPFFWLLVAIACLVAIVLLAAPTLAHADLRHGSEANLARSCAERPEHMFFNPTTGRTAFVCLVIDGRFGVAVVDELGNEVTAFVKNKMKTFEQVEQYLKNCGYGFIQ
jgi:hypothetical protein